MVSLKATLCTNSGDFSYVQKVQILSVSVQLCLRVSSSLWVYVQDIHKNVKICGSDSLNNDSELMY